MRDAACPICWEDQTEEPFPEEYFVEECLSHSWRPHDACDEVNGRDDEN